MKKSLVQFLRCPKTKKVLALRDEIFSSPEEVVAGTLATDSGECYPIQDGVPSMLSTLTASGQQETVASFSEKWKLAPDYRTATHAHYQQWYLERYGFGTLEKLRAFLDGKELILDAATGHGRDSELYATNSRAEVFGVDISYGIHNAYRDLHSIPNLNLVQADLTQLPFPEEFFDFVACDQALHHTPDTYQSFRALLRHLKPGGNIAIYVYKTKGPIREFCDDYIRSRTVSMSVEECMKFSEAMTKLGKALADLNVIIDVPEDIPLLEIKAGKQDIQRFIYWNVFKCYWNDTMNMDMNVITNFDWYHPLHAHRHTPEEVRGWFEANRVEILHFDEIESGISVIGKKFSRVEM